MSCQAPPLLSSQSPEDKVEQFADHPPCVWYNRCSNEPGAELPTNAINCSIPDPTSRSIPGNCYLWGSDGPHQQMLFIYLLQITPHNLTLHYFNDSYSSQQYLQSRQQLCTPNNNLDIAKEINQSCIEQETPPMVLQNEDLVCCNDINISIDFSKRRMEVYFSNAYGFINIPVDYLNCTRKSCHSIY